MTEPGEVPAGGFIFLWREFRSSPLWYKMPYSDGKLWLWILFEATHKGNAKRRGLPPGTFTTTYSEMCREMEWMENNAIRHVQRETVRRTLFRLQDDDRIAIKSCYKKNTNITVCNWSTYQEPDFGAGYNRNTTDTSLLNNVNKVPSSREGKPAGQKGEEKGNGFTPMLFDGKDGEGKTPAQKNKRKRDDWQGEMAHLWQQITPDAKIPWSMFEKWKQAFGPEMPLEMIKSVNLSGKKPRGLTAYLAKALRQEQERREMDAAEQRRGGRSYGEHQTNIQEERVTMTGPEFNRMPPQAVEVERAVLGAMILSPRAVAEAQLLLEPGDFYHTPHATIFAAIGDVHRYDGAVDQLTLTEYLKQTGHLDQIGGMVYISQLSAEVATGANITTHARIVLRAAQLRRLIELSTELTKRSYEGATDPTQIGEWALNKILTGLRLEGSRKGYSMAEIGAEVDTKLTAAMESPRSGLASTQDSTA